MGTQGGLGATLWLCSRGLCEHCVWCSDLILEGCLPTNESSKQCREPFGFCFPIYKKGWGNLFLCSICIFWRVGILVLAVLARLPQKIFPTLKLIKFMILIHPVACRQQSLKRHANTQTDVFTWLLWISSRLVLDLTHCHCGSQRHWDQIFGRKRAIFAMWSSFCKVVNFSTHCPNLIEFQIRSHSNLFDPHVHEESNQWHGNISWFGWLGGSISFFWSLYRRV